MYIKRDNALQMLKETIAILEQEPEHGIFYIHLDVSRCPGTNVLNNECSRISQNMVKIRIDAIDRNKNANT